MTNPMKPWIDLWDYLDGNFWGICQWLGRELTAEQIAWQPVPAVASISWNLRHLGEMLDHYLTKVFHAQASTVSPEALVTMVSGSRDDGRFQDLSAIMLYHRKLRPAYRKYLMSLSLEDLERPLSPRPDSPTCAWAIGHIAEHESYHIGKCTLLRRLLLETANKV